MDTTNADREIILTRIFNAPRELVWKAWTDRKLIDKWFGPKGFTCTTSEMDVRPGGRWRFVMHTIDGKDFANRIEYVELVKLERIVYTHTADIDGDPNGTTVTITLEEKEGKTQLMSLMAFPTIELKTQKVELGAITSGNQSLEKLANLIENSK